MPLNSRKGEECARAKARPFILGYLCSPFTNSLHTYIEKNHIPSLDTPWQRMPGRNRERGPVFHALEIGISFSLNHISPFFLSLSSSLTPQTKVIQPSRSDPPLYYTVLSRQTSISSGSYFWDTTNFCASRPLPPLPNHPHHLDF